MRIKLLIYALMIAFCCLGCAQEPQQIVVPVAGFGGGTNYNEKKAEMLSFLQSKYPKLKKNALDAIDSIPRMFFVNDIARHRAYEDMALPIGSGQASLKTSDIGFILSEIDLQPTDNVLEIGTGTGYLTVVMSRLAAQVYSIEIIEYLSELARGWVERLQITNAKLRNADGAKGWSRFAPFDVIVITAAVREWPPELVEQLKTGGRIIAPVIDPETENCAWIYAQKTDTALVEVSRQDTVVDEIIAGNDGE